MSAANDPSSNRLPVVGNDPSSAGVIAEPGPADDASSTQVSSGSSFIQSLERGLTVIKAFDAEHRSMTLSDVARRTGLTRAAARRFLLTLSELGYVHNNGRLFSLRPRVLDLGFAYLSSIGLPEAAIPHLERFVAEMRESSSMSVLDRADIVYVARVPTNHRIMTVTISVGTRFPAHATSMGRVLLSALDAAALDRYLDNADLTVYTPNTIGEPAALLEALEQVRQQGYSIVDQELEGGLRSAAAPVHDSAGDVVAAINVSTHAMRTSVEELQNHHVPLLLSTAKEISDDLRRLDLRPMKPSAAV